MGQDSTIDTFKFRALSMHPATVPVLRVWLVLQLARSLLHPFIAKTLFVRPLVERSPQGKFQVVSDYYERAIAG